MGAERVAENQIDKRSFGAIYRWNRATAYPSNGSLDKEPWDPRIWGDETINLKPGVLKGKEVKWSDDGWEAVNDPCPSGFNIPTKSEWEAEKIQNAADAFEKLHLPLAMYRALEGQTQGVSWKVDDGGFPKPDEGDYWSRTTNGDIFFYNLWINAKDAKIRFVGRTYGFSIRCIKNRWSLFSF